jgi:hypothetical protein
VNPLEYMQALAQLWGRGGKDLAAAQQGMFFDMMSSVARPRGVRRALRRRLRRLLSSIRRD